MLTVIARNIRFFNSFKLLANGQVRLGQVKSKQKHFSIKAQS